MFRLISVEDTVRIRPSELAKPLLEAVQAVLEETFADKVISEVGLVVATYDVQVEHGSSRCCLLHRICIYLSNGIKPSCCPQQLVLGSLPA